MGDKSGMITLNCENYHHQKLCSGLWSFFKSYSEVDCNVHWSGQSIRAHRLILSVFLSPDKLADTAAGLQPQHQQPDGQGTLDSLFEFLYQGKVTIRKEQLGNLLDVARFSDFKMLVDVLESVAKNDEVGRLLGTAKRSSRTAVVNRTAISKQTTPVAKKTAVKSTKKSSEDALRKLPVNDGAKKSTDIQNTDVWSSGLDLPSDNELTSGQASPKMSTANENKEDSKSDEATTETDSSDSDSESDHSVEPAKSKPKTAATTGKRYQCDKCPKSYCGAHNLLYHTRWHSGELPYQCTDCKQAFARRDSLYRHSFVHSGLDKPHKCSECSRTFLTKQMLSSHMVTHTRVKAFKCGLCESTFSRRSAMQKHQETHVSTRQYLCCHCPKTFKSKLTLHRHTIGTHSGIRPHLCSVCGKSFSFVNSLTIHQKSHLAEKPHKCTQCKAAFCVGSQLKIHMRNHDNFKPYKCDACPASFTLSYYLKRHQAVHMTTKPFHCEQCDRGFTRKCKLRDHLRLHQSGKPIRMPAPKRTPGGPPVPRVKKTFTCDVCFKVCHRKDLFTLHMITHSEDSKPNKCVVCGKGFLTRSTLKRHALIHTGTRPYKCDQCDKSFNKSHHLVTHTLTHGTQRPYNCQICQKGFLTRQNLNVHFRTHTRQNE